MMLPKRQLSSTKNRQHRNIRNDVGWIQVVWTLDLKSGYWHVGVHDDDKRGTAFCTGSGLFCTSLQSCSLYYATLQQRSRGYYKLYPHVEDLLSVLVAGYGQKLPRASDQLRTDLKRIGNAHLWLNPKNPSLFQKQVEFLYLVDTPAGTHADEIRLTEPSRLTQILR